MQAFSFIACCFLAWRGQPCPPLCACLASPMLALQSQALSCQHLQALCLSCFYVSVPRPHLHMCLKRYTVPCSLGMAQLLSHSSLIQTNVPKLLQVPIPPPFEIAITPQRLEVSRLASSQCGHLAGGHERKGEVQGPSDSPTCTLAT